MTVLVQNTTTNQLSVHMKGSPELIAKICISSTGILFILFNYLFVIIIINLKSLEILNRN